MTTAVVGIEKPHARSRALVWTGRVLSVLPVLLLAMSATMKLTGSPQVVTGLTDHYGYPRSAILGIGLFEIACAALYAIPQTAVFGAILMTGFLGGTIATHIRAGEPFLMPLVVAAVAWFGVYLRDGRLRALVPFRRSAR